MVVAVEQVGNLLAITTSLVLMFTAPHAPCQ